MPVARRQFTTLRSTFVTCINFIGRRTSSANRRRESGPVITREDVSGSKAVPPDPSFSSEPNRPSRQASSRGEIARQLAWTRGGARASSRRRNSFISTTAALDHRRFNRLNNNVQPRNENKARSGFAQKSIAVLQREGHTRLTLSHALDILQLEFTLSMAGIRILAALEVSRFRVPRPQGVPTIWSFTKLSILRLKRDAFNDWSVWITVERKELKF